MQLQHTTTQHVRSCWQNEAQTSTPQMERVKCRMVPLHHAARASATAALRVLLQAGAPVHAAGKQGHTPLHVAAW